MAKQTINIGAAPNDGTGTPLRTSFDYTNQNFTELYASLGGGTGLPGAVTQVLFNNGTNVAGDAGMTFNSTTDVLSVGGVTATGNVSVAGTFSARNGDNASAVRVSASDYAAVAFDGVTTSTRISAPCLAIGTGDFSLWARFRVPVVTPSSGGQGICTTSAGSSGAGVRAFGLRMNTTSLNITSRDGAGVTNRNAAVANFYTNFTGQVVDLVVTRSGATMKIYINGTDTSYTDTGSGAWSDTVTSSFLNVGIFDSTDLFLGRIYRTVVFNRVLSVGDVGELGTTGVNPADQWGTQTGATSGTLAAAKRYRITTYVAGDAFTNVGAASNATGVEFLATGTTPTTWTNASTLTRIGSMVDLDLDVGTGYQAFDRSTNNLHGTMFNGVEFMMPRRSAVLYATTNTSGNQQMLGTLAIPTNAIIEDIIVNSTGSATVSVGNVSAGTQVVNAAAVVSGRQKLTLATPYSTTGNLWVNSSTTSTLQFTISYTIAL